jgi:integrase
MLKLTRRHGSAHWYVRGTVAGRRLDESTGLTDRALAEAYRAKREWELSHASVYGQRGQTSFAEACALYLEHARNARFVGPLLDHFQTIALASIDQSAADRAAKALYPTAKPATLSRQLYTPLTAIMRHAAASGLCDPIRFRKPKLPPGKIRWLTEEESERLIDACRGRHWHYRALVVFLLYTGARAGEALTLDWRDVDLERAQVVFSKTKNGDARGVPLHPRAVAELKNLKHRAGPVFRTRSGSAFQITEGGGSPIAKGFAAIVAAAGLRDLTPHDLRHTWATRFYQATRNLTALQKLGGWRTASMVFRYTHANPSEFAIEIGRLPGEESGDPMVGPTEKRRKTA